MKKIIFSIFLILSLLIGGIVYFTYYKSPEYSLLKIGESVKNHDITSFEKYVDIDSITTRLIAETPSILGKRKDFSLFGDEFVNIFSGLISNTFGKIAKESIRMFIERGHFEQDIADIGSFSKIFNNLKIDNLDSIKVGKITKEGKICKVSINIFFDHYADYITCELMMRDKGSYWQVSELMNLNSIIDSIDEMKTKYPYKKLIGTTEFFAEKINLEYVKAISYSKIASLYYNTNNARNSERYFKDAIHIADDFKDNDIYSSNNKAFSYKEISKELAKCGQFEKSLEILDSILKIKRSFKNGSFDAESYRDLGLYEVLEVITNENYTDKVVSIIKKNNFINPSSRNIHRIATLLKYNNKDLEANEIINFSIERSDEIDDPIFKIREYYNIAYSYYLFGNIEKSKIFIDKIVDSSNKNIDSESKALLLLDFMSTWRLNSNNEELEFKKFFLNYLDEKELLEKTLNFIFGEYEKRKEDPKFSFLPVRVVNIYLMLDNFDKAHETANQIKDLHFKISVYINFSLKYIQQGNDEEAFKLANMKEWSDMGTLKDIFFQEIVYELIISGNEEKAYKFLNNDISNNQKIYQIERYINILLKEKLFEEAYNVFNNIDENVLISETDIWFFENIIQKMCIEFSQEGDLDFALRIANRINNINRKSEIYFYISQIWADKNDKSNEANIANRIMLSYK